MFFNAKKFNQPFTGVFSTSNVTNMTYMFAGAVEFNQAVNTFTMSKVTDTQRMFMGASKFNSAIWATLNAPELLRADAMFESASAFNKPIFINAPKLTNIQSFLSGAGKFNNILEFTNSPLIRNFNDMTLNCFSLNSIIFKIPFSSAVDTPSTLHLNNTAMTNVTYSAILQKLAANVVSYPATAGTIRINATGKKYHPRAKAARDILTNAGVTITDAGQDIDEVFEFQITTTTANQVVPMIHDQYYASTHYIDWGDGLGEQTYANGTAAKAAASRTYATPGVKTVKFIRGDYSANFAISFSSFSVCANLVNKVVKYGGLALGASTFFNCINMTTIEDTTIPILDKNSFHQMFQGCALLTNVTNIDLWPTSTVTNM